MMSEEKLKTLKEIEEHTIKRIRGRESLSLGTQELLIAIIKTSFKDERAEAVKWVKSFDQFCGDRTEFKTGAYWFCLNFFNLTEEDLKE